MELELMQRAIEAILFAAGERVEISRLAAVLEQDPADIEKAADALKGLKSAGGWLRRELGHALQLRYTPELVWELDDSITYGAKMLKLINSLEVKNDGNDDEN